jgi:hypothetical protein
VTNRGPNKKWALLAIIIIGLLLIAIGGYWVLKEEPQPPPAPTLPRMANLPPKREAPSPPEPSYPPDAPVLEQVRNALREGITPSEAVIKAEALPKRPESADAAFLLLEYAADSGNVKAALLVGRYYDPTYDGPSGSIRKNPTTAYEWYRSAVKGGQTEARIELDRLRNYLEVKSTEGSREAKELLSAWR